MEIVNKYFEKLPQLDRIEYRQKREYIDNTLKNDDYLYFLLVFLNIATFTLVCGSSNNPAISSLIIVMKPLAFLVAFIFIISVILKIAFIFLRHNYQKKLLDEYLKYDFDLKCKKKQ